MSAYVVLARKWRPSQFSDIVGQGPVVRTLINAIQSNRLHQAYLFTGSRGIGKTSIARILAKAIRCENVKNEKTSDAAQTIVSCNVCDACKEINSGTSVDVQEIDGASNNGVESIREIRESVKYLPASGKKKIYIVDEVHMLSTAAFNALLKTLEEPPEHILFIFATTEVQKIPATILSRCQRFDLKRHTVVQIQERLAHILKEEKIECEPSAITLVARTAEGSMRDALSTLDQVIAYSGKKITTAQVRESVGIVGNEVVFGILKGILDRHPKEALQWLNQAYARGEDLKILARSLLEAFHVLILMKAGVEASSLTSEYTTDELKELASLLELRTSGELDLFFQVFSQGSESLAKNHQPKILFDVLIVKCATAEALMVVGESETREYSSSAYTTAPATSHAPVQSPHSPSVSQAAPNFAAPVAPRPALTPTGSLAPSSVSPSLSTPNSAPAAPTAGKAEIAPFLVFMREKRPMIASLLEHAVSLEFPDKEPCLTIGFSKEQDHFFNQLKAQSYIDALTKLATEYFAKHTYVKVEIRAAGESIASKRDRESKERTSQKKNNVKTHPIVQEAHSLFGGTLGPIIIDEDEGSGGANAG